MIVTALVTTELMRKAYHFHPPVSSYNISKFFWQSAGLCFLASPAFLLKWEPGWYYSTIFQAEPKFWELIILTGRTVEV